MKKSILDLLSYNEIKLIIQDLLVQRLKPCELEQIDINELSDAIALSVRVILSKKVEDGDEAKG